jgi:hypothetical protein
MNIVDSYCQILYVEIIIIIIIIIIIVIIIIWFSWLFVWILSDL